MKRNSFFNGLLVGLTLALAAGCDGDGNNEKSLQELAGSWYNRDSALFSFEITEDGHGYIAEDETPYDVSISGGQVSFRYGNDTRKGDFRYTLSKGELTMSAAHGNVFVEMASASPFIKSGVKRGDDAVPVEFIGKWYAENTPSEPNFEITPEGKITISGFDDIYTVYIKEGTVSVYRGESNLAGKFQYTISHGVMDVRSGTNICEGLFYKSPFTKRK